MRTQEQNVRAAGQIFRFQVQVKIPVAEYKYRFPGKLQATQDNVAHLFLGYNSTLGCAKSKRNGNFENYMKIAFH